MSDPPLQIRAHQSEQVLELGWTVDQSVRVPYRLIRAQCPCAACRDEWTGARILDPDSIRADLKLEGMEAVGNYAVQFRWNDGHGSGIYTWDHLRALTEPPSDSEDQEDFADHANET